MVKMLVFPAAIDDHNKDDNHFTFNKTNYDGICMLICVKLTYYTTHCCNSNKAFATAIEKFFFWQVCDLRSRNDISMGILGKIQEIYTYDTFIGLQGLKSRAQVILYYIPNFIICLKSLQPPLLLLYLTCQVRYIPLKTKFLQENDFSHWKNSIPIRNQKFPFGIQYFLQEFQFREDLIKSDRILIFYKKNYLSESNSYKKQLFPIGNIISIGFLENPLGLSIFPRRIMFQTGTLIFLLDIKF